MGSAIHHLADLGLGVVGLGSGFQFTFDDDGAVVFIQRLGSSLVVTCAKGLVGIAEGLRALGRSLGTERTVLFGKGGLLRAQAVAHVDFVPRVAVERCTSREI